MKPNFLFDQTHFFPVQKRNNNYKKIYSYKKAPWVLNQGAPQNYKYVIYIILFELRNQAICQFHHLLDAFFR
jgi:hypothetical protein